MFYENLIALNPLNRDPNLRGEVPLAIEVQEIDPAAMVAGVTTTTVVSKFGLNKGELWGAFLLDTIGEDNSVLGCSVAAGSSDGEVDITIHSSDATDTTNLPDTTKVFIVGKIIPSDPS